jgi:hypothetical protein
MMRKGKERVGKGKGCGRKGKERMGKGKGCGRKEKERVGEEGKRESG